MAVKPMIALEGYLLVGLKSDGTVICSSTSSAYKDLATWSDIIHVGICNEVIYGLKSDKTLVACGPSSKLNYWDNLSSCNDIVDFVKGDTDYLICIKSDGTRVCPVSSYDISDYLNAVQVCNYISPSWNLENKAPIKAILTSTKQIIIVIKDLNSSDCVMLNITTKDNLLKNIVQIATINATTTNGDCYILGLREDETVVCARIDLYPRVTISSRILTTDVLQIVSPQQALTGFSDPNALLYCITKKNTFGGALPKKLVVTHASTSSSSDARVILYENGMCTTENGPNTIEKEWSDIVDVVASCNYQSGIKYGYFAGLKSDGAIVGACCSGNGTYNWAPARDWNLIAHKQGLLISKAGLNCTAATSVEGLDITGTQLEGTERALAFKVDDTWNKLAVTDGVAELSELPTQDITIESLLAEGNTVAELSEITSIPGFVGKTVYPAMALYADSSAVAMPSLGLKLKVRNNQDLYKDEQISQEYLLADTDVEIVSIIADTDVTGQAVANVMVSIKQSGIWSDWMTMLAAKGQKASAVKYKAVYTVSTLDGTDTAKVNSVSCVYCIGNNKAVSGDTAEIITITQNYENDLQFAQCMVKHKPLMDAVINAFVAFRSAPKKREMINIGTGNGDTQTITLADTGINHNTLSVQYDGRPVYDYSYNTETSQITFTAAEGVAVTATYQYGWEAETWRQMTAQEPQVYNDTGLYATKFTYTLPDDVTGKTISNIKVQLYRPAGTVAAQVLGTATGQRQLFVLPHYAKKETIRSNAQFSYDDKSRVLTVVGDKDSEIKVSYDWIAETHEVRGLVAGWAE